MNAASRRVRTVYLALSLCIWLPTALIVGVIGESPTRYRRSVL